MDIMEPRPNASTEQKQLASSSPAGAKKEGEGEALLHDYT